MIRGGDVEKIQVPRVTDNAEQKRVELHAHTKMSAMDGLCDVQDLIEMAAAWGHKAVVSYGSRSSAIFSPMRPKFVRKKKLDIKIIYGLK